FDTKRAFHGTKCDEPFNKVNCGNRTRLQEPQESEDGVCPRQNGRYEHQDPTVCDQYVECTDGTWNLLNCSPPLHYSSKIGQCTWPSEAKRKGCKTKKKRLPDGFECPDVDTSTLPGAAPKNPNPTFSHNTSCTQFYVCIGGVEPRLNVCNADLVYNIDTGTCDTYLNVPECFRGRRAGSLYNEESEESSPSTSNRDHGVIFSLKRISVRVCETRRNEVDRFQEDSKNPK
ncbi:unnamed protein product, partial [Notodromas monacha]